MIDGKTLGKRCKKFRTSLGITQTDVARELGYSLENVSAFECGRNDNCRILLWYLFHGFSIDEMNGGDDNDD